MNKVGIIGGAGFIGSYVTRAFLDQRYEVKVSTTDISREEKYKHLMLMDQASNLHVSELDVTDIGALRDFVSDCDIVVHGGTPFILDVHDPLLQLFTPTVKGTENFLEVISTSPQIKKVVIIASVAGYNTNFPFPKGGTNATDSVDENDAPFISPESHPYAQAKYIANQAVENFIRKHPASAFEITSVSPVAVMGKSLSDRTDSTSGGLQFLIKNRLAPNPFIQMLFDTDATFAIVDVEDVGQAIFTAATRTGLHGRNYLLTSESYKISDIHRMLNHQDPIATPAIVYKNDLVKKELGIEFKPAATTFSNYLK